MTAESANRPQVRSKGIRNALETDLVAGPFRFFAGRTCTVGDFPLQRQRAESAAVRRLPADSPNFTCKARDFSFAGRKRAFRGATQLGSCLGSTLGRITISKTGETARANTPIRAIHANEHKHIERDQQRDNDLSQHSIFVLLSDNHY